MPQIDRHRDRTIYVDYHFNEKFTSTNTQGRYMIAMITDGQIRASFNGQVVEITAPAIICLSGNDVFLTVDKSVFSAQSIVFDTDFFCTSETGELTDIPAGLAVFRRTDSYNGIIFPHKTAYKKLWEWFGIIGTETYAQSDGLWVCRIKKYLLQVIAMLYEMCRERENNPVNLALDYIHTSYFKKITLDQICRRAGTNRIYLNKQFKEKFGRTAIDYLNNYRIETAGKMLTYTKMNLADIANATGFEYDTYFIRRFTQRKGVSPTEYRKTTQKLVMGNNEIVM